MSVRVVVALLAFVLAFVINPAYVAGCIASSSSEPEFGEAEMLELLDAANEHARWQFESDGKRYELELSLMQIVGRDSIARARAPLVGSTAYACGTRTFMQSASACITVSELPVTGELTLRELTPTPRDIASQVQIQGLLWTDAHRLLFATLDLEFGESRVTLHSSDALSFELKQVQIGRGEADEEIAYEAEEIPEA